MERGHVIEQLELDRARGAIAQDGPIHDEALARLEAKGQRHGHERKTFMV
jgi:hypothetical protein